MSTLTPGKIYLVNINGSNLYSPIADTDGVIRFSHSNWPAGVFTVVEDISPAALGNITMTSYVNNTLLPGASVALYTRRGKLIDTQASDANGIVLLKNVPGGTYSAKVTKGNLYGSNESNVNVTARTSINLNMHLMYYDINGDGKVNVDDLARIINNIGKTESPVYDVNGDGIVDATKDIQVVRDHFDQSSGS